MPGTQPHVEVPVSNTYASTVTAVAAGGSVEVPNPVKSVIVNGLLGSRDVAPGAATAGSWTTRVSTAVLELFAAPSVTVDGDPGLYVCGVGVHVFVAPTASPTGTSTVIVAVEASSAEFSAVVSAVLGIT